MAVLKEFSCAAHGPFEEFVSENETPRCPHGCSTRMVTREIRTAVAHKSGRTRNTDNLMQDLAAQHKLTDISVKKDDNASVMQNLRKRENASEFGAFWGKNVNLSEFSAVDGVRGAMAGLSAPRPGIIDGSYKADLPEIT